MPVSPSDLPAVDAALLEVVSRVWGYSSLRPLQRDAMRAAIEGRDSLVVLPTGGGKSLCYQAPALITDGLTVVVSPLISLMKDQVDGLRANGVAAAQLNSSVESHEQRVIERDLTSGALKLLFVSPERLAMSSFRALLKRANISAFAIDEAHCISHWGHDFRPEYRQLRRLQQDFPDASIHAFTATATERVRNDIANELSLREPLALVGDFDRPNLTYRILPRREETKQVEEVLARHKDEAGVIYCIRRKDVDELTATLQRRGHRVVGYHAGMSAEDRHRAQEEFSSERVDVVVATVAFGMGIDRSNVRFVLHTGMPKSIEHYQQETGRAGRDGLEAECVLLYSPADALTWRSIIEKPNEDGEIDEFAHAAMRHVDDMQRYCGSPICRHRALVEYFGQTFEKESCGACDVCLDPPQELEDAHVVAQKILSCVYRLRVPFGGGYVASVLRGENTERIRDQHHDQLSTFGILADKSKEELRDLIDQLVIAGALRIEGDRYPVLRLTDRGRAILKNSETVRLAARTIKKKSEPKRTRAEEVHWSGVDKELFEKLRAWRRSEAQDRGVPPFVIFGDRTLREIAAAKPATLGALRGVYGVGEAKLEEFGRAVLEVVESSSPLPGGERGQG